MSRKHSDISPSARTIRMDRDEVLGSGALGRGEKISDREVTDREADGEALQTFFVEVSAGSEATTEASPPPATKRAARNGRLAPGSLAEPEDDRYNEETRSEPATEFPDMAADLLGSQATQPSVVRYRRKHKRKQKRSRYLSLSLLTHVTALVLLSTYTMQLPPRPEALELSTVPAVSEDELLEDDLEIEPIDEEELTAGLENETIEDPLAAELSLAGELEFESEYSDVADQSQNMAGLVTGELTGGGIGLDGIGLDSVDAEAAKVELPDEPAVTFFGEKIAGNRIVFLVDNSGGMNGGGLETLIAELLKTVERLTPKQQFYVIFYSDAAYPMFYPRSVFQFARPTKENKRQLAGWLETVELCTGNAVDEGLTAAITTRPDTVFLLTDGRVNTTRDGRKLAAFLDSRGRRFTINTFGMGTSPTSQATQQLKEIAAANGGRFKQVEITEEMKALAREKRRPYHNKQPGAVWGKQVGSW